jgi:hypothetical protein
VKEMSMADLVAALSFIESRMDNLREVSGSKGLESDWIECSDARRIFMAEIWARIMSVTPSRGA